METETKNSNVPIEETPEWKRRDLQKWLGEIMEDIREWQKTTNKNIPTDSIIDRHERAHIARIATAVHYARDCK